jgi:hypothetical protein
VLDDIIVILCEDECDGAATLECMDCECDNRRCVTCDTSYHRGSRRQHKRVLIYDGGHDRRQSSINALNTSAALMEVKSTNNNHHSNGAPSPRSAMLAATTATLHANGSGLTQPLLPDNHNRDDEDANGTISFHDIETAAQQPIIATPPRLGDGHHPRTLSSVSSHSIQDE